MTLTVLAAQTAGGGGTSMIIMLVVMLCFLYIIFKCLITIVSFIRKQL